MPTELLFRDDAYLKTATARVVAARDGQIELDRTIFYPLGGGQPDTAVALDEVLDEEVQFPGQLLDIEGDAIGQARFDQRSESVAEVSFSLAPAFRGRGFAAPAIRVATDAVFSESSLRILEAYVKPPNERSQRAFLRAGYGLTGRVQHAGQDAWQLRIEKDG